MIMSNMDKKVLIIDDELGPRESMRILLKNQYQVLCAESVNVGIDLLEKEKPDVVVMDIRMPGKSGIEGLREIRQRDQNIAVIMLTGFGALETAQEAIRLGANDYMKKPFDTEEMTSVIHRNIQRTRVNRKRAHAERELNDLNHQLVSELARKDKLASLGQASAELVHDLRNPMTVILGYIQILSEDLKKAEREGMSAGDTVSEYVDVIEQSVKRCRELIETWLRISRNDTSQFRALDINDLMTELIRQNNWNNRDGSVRLSFDPSSDTVKIKGDRIQVQRALQNVVNNAVDALGSHGHITITTEVRDGHAIISVRDDGCGITEDNINKIFDPYHTTKTAEKGTGLGLFITKKIVEDHDGSISIESTPGKGTLVLLTFPAC